MCLLNRTNNKRYAIAEIDTTKQENPDRLSCNTSAALGNGVKIVPKVVFLAALAIIGLCSIVPSITAQYKWPEKPVLLSELKLMGNCNRGGWRNSSPCLVPKCSFPDANKNEKCAEYCKICSNAYRESKCLQIEKWEYCIDFLEYYFKCDCKCLGNDLSCTLRPEYIQCKAIPEELAIALEPVKATAPPDPDMVVCYSPEVRDASITKCSKNLKTPFRLNCKEGTIFCGFEVAGSEHPNVRYYRDGPKRPGETDDPYTECQKDDSDKPAED